MRVVDILVGSGLLAWGAFFGYVGVTCGIHYWFHRRLSLRYIAFSAGLGLVFTYCIGASERSFAESYLFWLLCVLSVGTVYLILAYDADCPRDRLISRSQEDQD